MGEKGVGKLSQETPPPREGEPMGVHFFNNCGKHNSHSGITLPLGNKLCLDLHDPRPPARS